MFARDWGVHTSQPVIGPALIVVCIVMVAAAALVYRIAALGSVWTVPEPRFAQQRNWRRSPVCWRRR